MREYAYAVPKWTRFHFNELFSKWNFNIRVNICKVETDNKWSIFKWRSFVFDSTWLKKLSMIGIKSSNSGYIPKIILHFVLRMSHKCNLYKMLCKLLIRVIILYLNESGKFVLRLNRFLLLLKVNSINKNYFDWHNTYLNSIY